MNAPPLNTQQLNQVYQWIDQLQLSRPKKNITRDFSDGGIFISQNQQVLLAEVIYHYLPKFVQLQNYIPTTSANQKLTNWNNLNKKVLKKMNYQISKQDIQHIMTYTPDIIQRVLKVTQQKIKATIEKSKNANIEKLEVSRQAEFKKISQNQELKEFLNEKDNTIDELKKAISIFEIKIAKMEELVKIKDNKIQSLMTKLQQAG